MDSFRVKNGGIGIAFSAAGAGAPGFALVHGWCCDRTTMAPLADHLAVLGRAINVDLRGHGDSDQAPGPYRAGDFYSDVISSARVAGISRAVVVGHSMGGRVALGLGDHHPDFAAALVVLDSAVVESPEYVETRRRQLDAPDWRPALAARIGGMFLPTDRSTWAAALMLRTPHDVAVAALEAADEIDTRGALERFRGPVLYIGASRPREERARLQALNPDLIYGQVIQSGHFVQLDALTQVAAMIDRFCDLPVVRDAIRG